MTDYTKICLYRIAGYGVLIITAIVFIFTFWIMIHTDWCYNIYLLILYGIVWTVIFVGADMLYTVLLAKVYLSKESNG
tara:strand:+ start:9174 stop:9407 length:234 start_codon:yes stop_codon:yes gene_type:complete